MLHIKLQIPDTPHHIEHGHGRPFVILSPSSDEISIPHHRIKRGIIPSFPQRHHIQMIPQSNGIIPVLLFPADGTHIVFFIFRKKTILPAHGKHFIHRIPAGLSERPCFRLRIRNTGNPHQSFDILRHFFPVFLKPLPHLFIGMAVISFIHTAFPP